MFQCTDLWQPSSFFKHTISIKLIDWHNLLSRLNSTFLLSCALGFTALAVALQATRVMPFHFRRHTMASKADLIFVEDAPLVPLPIIHLSACKCVRTKDFLLAVKSIFPLLRMPKNQRHLLGFDLLVHFYLQPDRCKRLFLQPPASHSRCPSFKGPLEIRLAKSLVWHPGWDASDGWRMKLNVTS